MRKLRIKAVIAALLLLAVLVTGCGAGKEPTATPSSDTPSTPTDTATPGPTGTENGGDVKLENLITVDFNTKHQTWEGFGASSCWWSQYVGSWDKPYKEGDLPVREQIARWLYSRDEGIGLTIYRYNVGAGSADSGLGKFWDPNRRAHSFIGVDGEYNWNRDKYAVWFLNRCVELGAKDVVFFCNSPLDKLTVNGLAHMSEDGSINLLPENYDDFAKYVFDVVEHFRGEGIPVTYVSPINEPQWEWKDGQEGCHYSADEVVGVLKAFVEELRNRGLEDKIEITSPEGGEWKGSTRTYVNAILSDEVLGKYFKKMDVHSYWSGKADKTAFKNWIDTKFPGTGLVMSEWCEMVNGRDWTMDSAFNMADVIYEDMTILDVSSWQYWVGVADGDYRDGLIYVNKDAKAARPNRRLWEFGNYSRYIRPGFTRIDFASDEKAVTELRPVVFTGIDDGDGKEKCVMVFINRGDAQNISLAGVEGYSTYEIHTTAEEKDLELTASGNVTADTVYEIEGQSVVTVVLSK